MVGGKRDLAGMLAAAMILSGCSSQVASSRTVTVVSTATSTATVTVTASGPATAASTAVPARRTQQTLPTASITASCQLECATTGDDLHEVVSAAVTPMTWDTGDLVVVHGEEKIEVSFAEVHGRTGGEDYDLKVTRTVPGAVEQYAIRNVNGERFFGGPSLMKKLGLVAPLQWTPWTRSGADSTLDLLRSLAPVLSYRQLVVDYLKQADHVIRGSRGSLSGDLQVEAQMDVVDLYGSTGVPDLSPDDFYRALGRQPLTISVGLNKANLPTSFGWSTTLNGEELSLRLTLFWFDEPAAIKAPNPGTVAD